MGVVRDPAQFFKRAFKSPRCITAGSWRLLVREEIYLKICLLPNCELDSKFCLALVIASDNFASALESLDKRVGVELLLAFACQCVHSGVEYQS